MKMLKTVKINRKVINNGFSLVEIIISVTLISIFFSVIFFGFFSIIKIENVSKKMIYNGIDELNNVSQNFYLKRENE
ncbi:MAG TPA: prepilin-type N-terminal cleavage/methylation domain-containing protein [Spirochaetota bacterium]|nr:prepilin-type N-terminal cleavage/methylation domain-containing protein [Spirochaetota bacterium]